LSFTPDGQRVVGVVAPNSAGVSQQLLCWDVATGSLQKSLTTKELRFMDAGTIEFQFTSGGGRVVISSRSAIANIAYLCDLTGPEPRVLATFADLPLLTHDGTRLAVSDNLSGLMPLFALMSRPEQKPAKEGAKSLSG
jgi:hypothetical protein